MVSGSSEGETDMCTNAMNGRRWIFYQWLQILKV